MTPCTVSTMNSTSRDIDDGVAVGTEHVQHRTFCTAHIYLMCTCVQQGYMIIPCPSVHLSAQTKMFYPACACASGVK